MAYINIVLYKLEKILEFGRYMSFLCFIENVWIMSRNPDASSMWKLQNELNMEIITWIQPGNYDVDSVYIKLHLDSTY